MRLFFEVGPTQISPMGEAPLTWQELDAYARQMALTCEPWESLLLIEMSTAYMEGRAAGENPLGIAPMEQVVG